MREYVHACFDPATSSFALTPGGATTLHSIAEGHVALVMLGDTGDRWTHNLLDLVTPLVQTPWTSGSPARSITPSGSTLPQLASGRTKPSITGTPTAPGERVVVAL